MPNPANRRIVDRSVVALDSSWPDCQESWKPGVQPLQVRVQVVPHGLLHAGDRAGLDPAPVEVQPDLDDAERHGGQPDRQQQAAAVLPGRPAWLALAIGPSMAALVSSGITISAVTEISAAASMKASRQ